MNAISPRAGVEDHHRPLPVPLRPGGELTDPATVQRLLDLPLGENDSGEPTVHGYLVQLLLKLWSETGNFTGSAPFGNSDWQYEVYKPMVEHGIITGSFDEFGYVITCDTERADELIKAAIWSLLARSPFDEPSVSRWTRAETAHHCATCRQQVTAGQFVAVLDTTPETVACADCIEDGDVPIAQVVVTGTSDDVIDVSGDLSEEFQYYRDEDGGVLVFSDGTVLRVQRPDGTERDHVWRINMLASGSGHLRIEPATGDAGTDTATITGDIRWVVRGREFQLARR